MADQNQKEKAEVAILNPLNRTVFYSIEFPGYVNPGSVQKCVQRLGGLQNISDTFRRGLKIDLPLKENDPFAHPAAGQTVATQNLVLRIVKRRRRKQQVERDGSEDHMRDRGSSHSGTSTKQIEGVFTAEVVGISQKTMRFRNPIDFQYRPDMNDPVVQLRQAMMRLDSKFILSYRIPDDEEDFTLTPEEQERRGAASSSNLRITPAPMFTRYDMPMNYNFKQNSSLVRQNIIDKETGERSTRLVHASKIHDGSILAIKWGEPTPLECGPEREPLRALVRPDLLRKLEMLFERRPVWTRQGILNQLEDDEVRTMHSNRPIWSICSYVFHDGPWRDSVLRLGYDPRQDPEAYKYQIVSIRNQRNSTTRPSVLQSASQSAGSRRDRLSHQFDGVHVRTGGTFQLCDITDPLTRKVIDAPENRLQTCNEKDGYLTNAASSRIKALVKFKHQRLCDTGNAPEDEECTDFLLPDEEFLGVVRKYSTDRRQRKRSKAKGPDIEEEKVARRLERLVSRMETD